MKAVMNELEKNDDIILFIDEIHTIVGAGGATGSLDASNMFKPALARGEIQCIGATTLDEYRQYIEKDGALERRFQKVMVEPTTVEETIEILNNIKGKYEDHHNVNYTDEAIIACVKLTNRYMTDRFCRIRPLMHSMKPVPGYTSQIWMSPNRSLNWKNNWRMSGN